MNRFTMATLLGCSILFLESAVAGGRGPSPDWVVPSRIPEALVPEVQTDDFSCGYHALAAIYRSHGVDPEVANLRYRLGTSIPAIPFVEGSTGTLQPDLFRVLRQDGFEAETFDVTNGGEKVALIEHLGSGLYALALTETERAGGLHWVVFTKHQDGQVTVADSLVAGLQIHDLDGLIDGNLLSVTLITPGIPDPESAYGRAHLSGLGQVFAVAWRSTGWWLRLSGVAVIGLAMWWGYRRIRKFMRRVWFLDFYEQ